MTTRTTTDAESRNWADGTHRAASNFGFRFNQSLPDASSDDLNTVNHRNYGQTKRRFSRSLILAISLLPLALCVSTHAQGTAFTYQGQLSDSTNGPLSGSFDFFFSVWTNPSGPAQVGSGITKTAVSVSNGLFTVTLDFGTGIFTGADRWLEISVRPSGGGGFTPLTPRQKLSPTPYAITAGNLPAGASPAFTGTPSFNAPSGPPFNVLNAAKVPNLNADLLDGLDSTAFVLKAGDTMVGNLTLANPATLNFGSSVRQMLNLWDTQYGIGVQANTLYSRSHNNFAWFKDGVHSDTVFDPGAGGKVLMTLENNSRLNVPGLNTTATLNEVNFVGRTVYSTAVNGVANGDGNTAVAGRASGVGSSAVYGEASATSGESWGVRGISDSAGGNGVYGLSGGGTGSHDPAGVRGESTAFDGNGVVGVANNGSAAYGVWGRSTGGYGGRFVSSSGYAGRFDGAVQINFDSPYAKPQLLIEEPNSAGFARLRMQTGTQPSWDIALGTGAGPDYTNSLRFFSSGPGGGDVVTVSPQGHMHVRVLTIDGGADVAEPFEMSETNLSKGAVVVIDSAHPGQLKLSTTPYDTRVAGVISGAGDVHPGLSLNQRGVMEGDQPVALSGRVYVQADASYAAIQPGDLLTTSDTPGRAMKVMDHGRAQGAILGKAMTALTKGKGLVLVLVTLQ